MQFNTLLAATVTAMLASSAAAECQWFLKNKVGNTVHTNYIKGGDSQTWTVQDIPITFTVDKNCHKVTTKPDLPEGFTATARTRL
ncbi:hypothetical protein MCOR27_006803 [Pyricularia oryzae]|uniref:Uncharacterized protein n=1 Tax=Pyricularia grisea TaxID=148305 RepID=A0ABQ8NL91_PYRGI|nr:hypothetical protein MCOR01_005689 [Pyricularia oryzae]KAI6298820.1 hypothetical protein MCOR33_005104 [Pyricularia grisea]KAI6260960.1 hypothetical protein MCOR19_002722 [Pyricularia oryzae]KAI6272489.1 hypothetical protein MCOR26_007341 [Pyricularia oryzae]KAI6275748.1 hypothetical protein MCOR27_006803 [Pyricularia oryzae]